MFRTARLSDDIIVRVFVALDVWSADELDIRQQDKHRVQARNIICRNKNMDVDT